MMTSTRYGTTGWTLGSLLDGIVPDSQVLPSRPLSGLALDSRSVRANYLFLAAAGIRHHGLEFLQEALAKGAVAVLAEPTAEWTRERLAELHASLGIPVIGLPDLSAELSRIAARYYNEPARQMRMVGITGTNGKTSISQFLAQALPASWHCAVIGTLGNGFPGALAPATHTTPDAVRLQQELANLRSAGAGTVAMEVSSHALHQHRVAAVPFHTAVFSNLSRDHLDYHGSMSAYGEAKARLFRGGGLQLAVINTDDDLGRQLAAELNNLTRVVACCSEQSHVAGAADYIRLRDLSLNPAGLSLSFDSSWGRGKIRSRLLGRFNAENLLLVLGIMLGWGLPLTEAVERIQELTTVSGRMETFGGDGLPLVVVDFAHTPDAIEKVLLALRAHTQGRLICVFGCGGDRDQGKRPEMGAQAERYADYLVLTDDNPRHEPAGQIIQQIMAGLQQPQMARVIQDRAQAIRHAIGEARVGDVVVLAGKGHEDYQQVGDLKLPFSDTRQVQQILQEMAA